MGRRGEGWVIAQAVLFVVFIFLPSIGPAWPHPLIFQIAGWILAGTGAALITVSAINLGRSLTPFPKPLATGTLVISGAYRFVRHPIYSGVLIAAVGLAIASESSLRLLLALLLFGFFDRKASREEQWLRTHYAGYVTYQGKVKKLIPWIY